MAIAVEARRGGPMVADQMVALGKWRLPAQELAALKVRLREHRRFRQNQLRDLADPARSRSEEHCTAARIEVHGQLTAAAVTVLSDIDAALIRMNTGQYGDCQTCGAAIGVGRLRIVPHTRYCARCHRAEEIGA